jgi:hypothetical protein
MFIKWSILLFYQRIFGTKSSLRWVLPGCMTIICLWAISVLLETLLLCRPVSYNWDATVEGTCGDRNTVYVVAGATNMVTDFAVILVPIPYIWQLQMPTSQRVGLIATFSLGLLLVFMFHQCLLRKYPVKFTGQKAN